MEYISTLTEPTIIIGLLIAIFAKYLSKLGEFAVNHATLMPTKVLTVLRVRKWKYKRSLLLNSRNQSEVTWQIIRTYAFMLMFCILFFTYMFLTLIGPLKGSGNLPTSVQLFIGAPIFVFETLWLLQRSYTRDLIYVCNKYM